MENVSEYSKMSGVELASEIIQKRIAPVGLRQSVADRIRHAARKLGWSYSRTKEIWYRNARTIQFHEMQKAKEVAGVPLEKHEELEDVDDLVERAETLLRSNNPRVRRALFAAMRTFARNLVGARTAR
jgi:hypothetical protein